MNRSKQKFVAHSVRAIGVTVLAASCPTFSWAASPTAGSILQQVQPPPVLPQAPGPVISLPAPAEQTQQASINFAVSRINIEGNSLIPTAALGPLVESLQGHTVNLADLQQGAARITALYQSRGYPLAYAYLPKQEIKDGVVTIVVVEPRYDKIELNLDTRLDLSQARKTLGLKPGDPIEQSSLDRGLLLLNQTPGVRVAGTLVPGAAAGTSTLKLKLDNTPLLRASISTDNYGSSYTGRMRTQIDASLDNPFGQGSQIAANGLVSEGGLLNSRGVSLLSPNIKNGLRAGVYGSRTLYRLGGSFAALQERGSAEQLGVDFTMPLILAPGRVLNARFDALQTRLTQTSALSSSNDSESYLNLLRLTFNGAYADASGGLNSGGVVLTEGRKYFGSNSASTSASDAAGPQTAGIFWIGQLQLQRTQPLPAGLSLNAALSGQMSSKNLDGSEKFYLGGPDGVMYAPVGSAGGDQGMLARLRLSHNIPLPMPGRLDGSVLLQAGQVWLNRNTYVGAAARNQEHLAGAGFGLTYQWANHVSSQIDYVHRLGNPPSSSANSLGEFWANLQLSL